MSAVIKVLLRVAFKVALLYVGINLSVVHFRPDLRTHLPFDVTRVHLPKDVKLHLPTTKESQPESVQFLQTMPRITTSDKIPDHSVIEFSLPAPRVKQQPNKPVVKKSKPTSNKVVPHSYIGSGDVPMGRVKRGGVGGKTVFKWQDEYGTWHFTDKPVKDKSKKMETVTVLPDANMIKLEQFQAGDSKEHKKTPGKKKDKSPLVPNANDKSPLEQARDAKKLLEQKMKEQQEILDKEI